MTINTGYVSRRSWIDLCDNRLSVLMQSHSRRELTWCSIATRFRWLNQYTDLLRIDHSVQLKFGEA